MTENRYISDDATERVKRIKTEIAQAAGQAGRAVEDVTLMAVTKTRTSAEVNEVIRAGVTLLGENRAQELCARYDEYEREGCSIHFIGRLQTNKVRQIVDKVDMIESVDSLRLATEISRQCEKRGKKMDILLELNIGDEQSKGGFSPNEIEGVIREIATLPAVFIRGLMVIPPFSQKLEETLGYFDRTRRIFVDISHKNIDNVNMEILSMGMSSDFVPAITCGSTIVRVGTALFGQRM